MKKMLLWMLCAGSFAGGAARVSGGRGCGNGAGAGAGAGRLGGPAPCGRGRTTAPTPLRPAGRGHAALGRSGWYYAYVPGFVQNAIVSANDAAVQTEGVVIEAGKARGSPSRTIFPARSPTRRRRTRPFPNMWKCSPYTPMCRWPGRPSNLWAWSAPDGTKRL